MPTTLGDQAPTMSSLRSASRGRRLDAGFLVAFILVGASVGFLGTERRRLALAVVVVTCLAGFVAARPVLAAVVALPALYGFQGFGVGGGLGISDAALVAAAMLALPALAHTRELQSLGILNRTFAVYVVLLVPSLIANQTGAADREVVHRVILVTAATLVGGWLVKEHAESAALRLLLVASAAMAVACVVESVRTGFAPAEPFGYNKNYVGSLLALTLLVALCAPAHLGLKASLRIPAIALLVAGTVASQSRGAILGAAAGALIWLFAPRQGTGVRGRNRVMALVLAASFTAYAGYSVQQQLTSANAETNSAGVRTNVEKYTRELWRTSPLVGIGVRYFNTHDYGPLGSAPNNAFDSELAEAGLVGTAGFTFFHVSVLVALWRRRRSQLGLAALALVAGQLLHGQFDIYWSSGITPLPFLVAGMAVAATARPEEVR
jgi:hypothetical protein